MGNEPTKGPTRIDRTPFAKGSVGDKRRTRRERTLNTNLRDETHVRPDACERARDRGVYVRNLLIERASGERQRINSDGVTFELGDGCAIDVVLTDEGIDISVTSGWRGQAAIRSRASNTFQLVPVDPSLPLQPGVRRKIDPKLRVYIDSTGSTYKMCAARSQAEARKIMGVGGYHFKQYVSETGNQHDINRALSEPGVLLEKSNRDVHVQWARRT